MWIPLFILVISAAGCICDDFECYLRENKCDAENTLPNEFPDTVDELKTICQDVQKLGTCTMDARKKCGYSEDVLADTQRDMNYLKEVCKEENPIFKVISSNLECIKSASKDFGDICDTRLKTEGPMSNFVNKLVEEEDNDSLRCLYTLIDVTCPAIVAGHRCGNDEVRNSINALLGNIRKLEAACPEEARGKLDSIYDTYKSQVLEALNPRDEMEARK